LDEAVLLGNDWGKSESKKEKVKRRHLQKKSR
jgi:hypothetical protein